MVLRALRTSVRQLYDTDHDTLEGLSRPKATGAFQRLPSHSFMKLGCHLVARTVAGAGGSIR